MENEEEKVFVVDDDTATLEFLQLLLQSVGLVVQTFVSAHEFLQAYHSNMAGCLVADIEMPGMDGLELQKTLVAQGIQLPIVFITGHADVPMATQALKKGAFDFIQKPFNAESLLQTIRQALQQDRKQRTEDSLRESIEARLVTLTAREREVLDRIMEGKPNKRIAADLGISARTIEIHRARTIKKMDAVSVQVLMRMLYSSGIYR